MPVHHAPVGASTREGLIPPGDYNIDENGFVTSGPYYGRQIAGYPLQLAARPVGGPAQQFPSPTAFHQQVPASQHVGARGPQFVYNREQKGHSLILHLLLGGFVLWIPAIYFTVSPNHYWHA